RHAPRRIQDAGDGAQCALWALGRPLEIHLAIDASGRARELPLPPPASARVTPFDAALGAAVESVVVAQSAPALARPLRDVMRATTLEWGPVDADLVAVTPTGLRVSTRLHDAAGEAIRSAPTRPARLALALATVTETAALCGDHLRTQAQTRLAGLSEAEQEEALGAAPEGPSAQAIAAGAEALVAGLA